MTGIRLVVVEAWHPADRKPLILKEGDRVVFSSYAGTEVVVDGEDLLIMSVDDILAAID